MLNWADLRRSDVVYLHKRVSPLGVVEDALGEIAFSQVFNTSAGEIKQAYCF